MADCNCDKREPRDIIELKTPLFQACGGRLYRLHILTSASAVEMGDGMDAETRINSLERALLANTTTYFADTYEGMKMVGPLTAGDRCYVFDATGDPTVPYGSAMYIWLPSRKWHKLYNGESPLEAQNLYVVGGGLTHQGEKLVVKISDLYTAGKGLAQDAAGKLIVRPADFLGNGFRTDASGKIILDVSIISSQELEALIKKLLQAGGGAIFVQRGGRAIRDMGYSFQDDRYNAADLSILARRIFQGRSVRRWCWQQEPWSVIWIVLSDGTLAGLTYLREYEVMAWHRHVTRGEIFDIISLPRPDGLNAVILAVRRSQEYFLEYFDINEAPDASFEYLDGRDRLPFTASIIPCLPEIAAQDGTTFLMVKKINSIKALVSRCAPFQARVHSQGAKPSPLMAVPAAAGSAFVEEAVWNCPLVSGLRENPRLELFFNSPAPAAVQALLINFEVSDMAGGQG